MIQIEAGILARVTPETIRCPGWEEPRELGCIDADGDRVVISVWPATDDAEGFDEFELQASDVVEVPDACMHAPSEVRS